MTLWHIAAQIDLHGALFRMVRNMVGCMVPWMQPMRGIFVCLVAIDPAPSGFLDLFLYVLFWSFKRHIILQA